MEGEDVTLCGFKQMPIYFHQFTIEGISLQFLSSEKEKDVVYKNDVLPRLKELTQEAKQIKKENGL